MLPITHLNYDLDIEKVLEIANIIKPARKVYDNNMPNWTWAHVVQNPYLRKIKDDLDITGWIDFYFQESNSFVVPHIDPKSRCSVNFILTPDPAPITFYENARSKDDLGAPSNYCYTQAILNTSKCHAVQTTDTERILLKICSTEDYESVVLKLKNMVK